MSTAPALLALLALLALRQDPPPLGPHAGGANDAAAQARELIAKVERTLRAIDILLSDAAAGEVPLALPEDSGLDDLLRNTQEQSRGVVHDMDELMRIAPRQPGSSSSPPSGSPPPPPDSQGGQRDEQQQQPEQTPELPGERPEGAQPEPKPSQPDGGDARDEDTQNHANEPPQGGEKDAAPVPRDEGERWGELPPRVREVFRSQGGGDLPVQYRDWIDSYYRRLYQRP